MGKLIGSKRAAFCVAATLCIAAAWALSGAVTAYGVFGPGGKETLNLGGRVEHVVPDRGGRMLLFGSFSREDGIVRTRRDGSIDRTFGKNGFVRGIGGADFVVQPDGGIMLISTDPPSGASEVLVRRLSSDGRPDRSFGNRGMVSLDLGKRFAEGTAIANAGGGKVWIGGTRANMLEDRGGRGDAIAVVGRLTPEGRLDRTFSRDGLTTLPTERRIVDLTSSSNHSILAVTNGSPWLEAFRLRRNGAVDTSFGQGGRTPVGVPNPRGTSSFSPIERVCALRGGGFIVAGTLLPPEASQEDYVAVTARYRANGRLDKSYGSNGFAKVGFSGLTLAAAFSCRHDGRLVVAVDSVGLDTGQRRFGLISLRGDGKLDRRFGHAGKKLFEFHSDTWVSDLAFQFPNRIVVAGFHQAYHRPNKNVLIRLPLVAPRVR